MAKDFISDPQFLLMCATWGVIFYCLIEIRHLRKKVNNNSLRGNDFNDRKDLSGADFSKKDLYKANFMGSNLEKADFSFANLRGAYLCGANLQGADLYKAELQGALLRKANLRDANLNFADLRDANITDADFNNAILTRAKVTPQQAEYLSQQKIKKSHGRWFYFRRI